MRAFGQFDYKQGYDVPARRENTKKITFTPVWALSTKCDEAKETSLQ